MCPTCLISCESHELLKVPFCHFHLSENEWIYEWTFMVLKDFRVPLLSFELIHVRNFFCYRIENNWNFKYKILSLVSPLGTNLIFCLSWDSWNFKIFYTFYLFWSCPTQNLFETIWIMLLLQIFKKLWSFIIYRVSPKNLPTFKLTLDILIK